MSYRQFLTNTATPSLSQMKHISLLLLWLVGISLLTGCFYASRNRPLPGWKELVFRGQTMGTDYTVRFLIKKEMEKVRQYKEGIDNRLQLINGAMSTYQEDSEISLLNQSDSFKDLAISYELGYLIKKSLSLSELTEGAYDITAGPLINLWGFGPAGERTIPTSSQIAAAKKVVGYRHLQVNIGAPGKRGWITKKENQFIDLSSIAKGYGVDEVGRYLIANGFTNYMVEIGGEVQTKGVNIRGRRWRIGIRAPSKETTRLQKVVSLDNESLASSGDYENYFTSQGVRYSHIINPLTGRPITHNLVSVSVIHQECTLADGWATALLVLGEERGRALALREGIAAFFITRDEKGKWVESWTPSFATKIDILSEERKWKKLKKN